MLGRLLSKEFSFFEHFDKMADLCVEAATQFRELIGHPDQAIRYSQKIKALEQQADEVAHQVIGALHNTFITPLDRDDILLMVKRLDDVMDFVEGAAQRIMLYEIGEMPKEMKALAEIGIESIGYVKQVVSGLKNLKNREALLKMVVEINRLENDADQVFRSSVAALFKEEPDLRRLIKLKEIFELLETLTDRCEDVSNIIESIVLEYS